MENNKYTLENFQQEGLPAQEITFYKLNPDGSYENGTTLEEMLRVSFERLTDLNSRFPCLENEDALKGIAVARERLEARTKDRVARGVEGKHEV